MRLDLPKVRDFACKTPSSGLSVASVKCSISRSATLRIGPHSTPKNNYRDNGLGTTTLVGRCLDTVGVGGSKPPSRTISLSEGVAQVRGKTQNSVFGRVYGSTTKFGD